MESAQKLISTRRGSLYLAAGAAVLAGILILVYLNQYRDNLKSGTTPVTVLVAKQTIPKGTPGSVVASKALFTAATIRESQLREGALSDPASLAGRVATHEIYEGSQLTAEDFSASAELDREHAHRPPARRGDPARLCARPDRHGRRPVTASTSTPDSTSSRSVQMEPRRAAVRAGRCFG